jgi:RHS repeat-associated protein
VRNLTGSQANDFTFAGEQVDGSTGLQYLRARCFDPAAGWFISRDKDGNYGWHSLGGVTATAGSSGLVGVAFSTEGRLGGVSEYLQDFDPIGASLVVGFTTNGSGAVSFELLSSGYDSALERRSLRL